VLYQDHNRWSSELLAATHADVNVTHLQGLVRKARSEHEARLSQLALLVKKQEVKPKETTSASRRRTAKKPRLGESLTVPVEVSVSMAPTGHALSHPHSLHSDAPLLDEDDFAVPQRAVDDEEDGDDSHSAGAPFVPT
jgi:hypothetical protein